jgi:hypothetical protein
MITAQTSWRTTGRCPFETWLSELKRKGSPILPEAREAWEAAGDISALCLSQMMLESEAGTTGAGSKVKNPMNLSCGWSNGGHVWCSYPTWTAGIFAWRQWLLDPSKPFAKTDTIAALINVYAPPVENDTRHYVDFVVERLNSYGAGKGTPVPPSPVTPEFGKVPRPAIKLDLVEKPEGAGWSNYGPRDNLVAIVFHTVLGRASTTGDYFRRFDPAYNDGGHGYNALTDWGVCNQIDGPALDGTILEWNDPNSNRSPWASGGEGAPNGDGPALLALCKKLGRNLNQITEAIEVSRLHNGDPVSNKCMDSIIKLTAWRVDAKAAKNGTSYKTWPRNGYGTMMTITHAEMGKAGCNAGDIIDEVQRGVLEVLTFYQGKGLPVPPVVPVTTKLDAVTLPDGITVDDVRKWLGPLADPNGSVTVLLAEEGARTGVWSPIVEAEPVGPVRRFRCANGTTVISDSKGVRIARRAA